MPWLMSITSLFFNKSCPIWLWILYRLLMVCSYHRNDILAFIYGENRNKQSMCSKFATFVYGKTKVCSKDNALFYLLTICLYMTWYVATWHMSWHDICLDMACLGMTYLDITYVLAWTVYKHETRRGIRGIWLCPWCQTMNDVWFWTDNLRIPLGPDPWRARKLS